MSDLHAALDEARAERDAARTEAATATDSAIRAESVVESQLHQLARSHADRLQAERDAARAEGELAALRAQALLDTEDRAVLRALLRTARRRSTADRVYALFRRGALHSVHATLEAAEAAAEAEGAPRSGWATQPAGAGTPSAAEVAWRVQPLPLGGLTTA
ncbi:hypothetical protein [Streptomyces sp. DH12]|uniref:hypothetical protein n=1 Tax=Streptomyces sp. DH12 TaxID=2857010 RepID=UPI001E4F7862|nr:hypothetical protein [Streptomyces sp. DH12]